MKKILQNIKNSTISAPIIMFSLWLFSCIGTDYITDPPMPVQNGKIKILTQTQAIMVDSLLQFTAKVTEAGGSINNTIVPEWSSSDTLIVSINADGLATGKLAGQAWIFAKKEGYDSDSLLLSVVDNIFVLAMIKIEPDSAQLNPGDSLQFTAKGFNLNGDEITGINFLWSSSNPNVATVNDSGLVFAQNSGTANITASSASISSNPAVVKVVANTRSGMFTPNPNTGYMVSGTAELKFNNSGDLILEFLSDFQSSNGPGLYVYLTQSTLLSPDNIELGVLKSTSGAQTYQVPQGIDLYDYGYVIIHCKPFNVTFGSAKFE